MSSPQQRQQRQQKQKAKQLTSSTTTTTTTTTMLSTPTPTPPTPPTTTTSTSTFPIARTTSRLGVHTSLLIFTAAMLPRSTYVLLGTRPPEPASSRDKPQAAFLRPLTGDVGATMGWVVAGTVVVLGVWAVWVEGEMRAAMAVVRDRGAVGGKVGGGGGGTGVYAKEESRDDEEKVRWAAVSGRNRVLRFKDALVGTLAASFFFHLVLIFFGAPIVDQFSKTYLLAVLLSLLTVFANAYVLRLPSLSFLLGKEETNASASTSTSTSALYHRLLWLRLFVELAPRTPYERLLTYPVVGTLIGAWLGATPIALDWDRPWQAWPLTPAYGAIAGYIVASWCALSANTFWFLVEAGREEEQGQSRTSSDGKKITQGTAVAASASAGVANVASTTRSKTKKGEKKKKD